MRVKGAKMNWPKAWIELLKDMECKRHGPFWDERLMKHNPNHDDTKLASQYILDRLHEIGALKDPPQPRAIWWCPKCRSSFVTHEVIDGGPPTHHSPFNSLPCTEKPIKMREELK